MKSKDNLITYKITSPEIRYLCEADKRLALVVAQYGDLTYNLYTDGFAFIIETIVGQMLSNKVADAIAARLVALCGGSLTVEAIERLEQTAIKGIGVSSLKADYIKGFATLVRTCPSFFEELDGLDDKEVLRRMTSVRGIGAWSAKMYLIFVLNRLDVLPYEDGAFMQAYRWLYATDDMKSASISKKCEAWKPYSSLAARYLYRALDSGMVRDADLSARLNLC